MAKSTKQGGKPNDTLYRFVAQTSVIIPAVIRGFKQNLKFSVAFEGSSHYSTSDVDKAAAVRASALFKSGAIREVESVPVGGAPAAKKQPEAKPVAASPWLQSIKSVTAPKPATPAAAAPAKAEKKPKERTRKPKEAEQETLFPEGEGSENKLTIEDVDNYTDAKNYLRDELGMPDDVMAAADVAQWAEEHGVTFPNYTF